MNPLDLMEKKVEEESLSSTSASSSSGLSPFNSAKYLDQKGSVMDLKLPCIVHCDGKKLS